MAARYWTEMSDFVLQDKPFIVPTLSECGITIEDDVTGPRGAEYTQYIKVYDEEAPESLEGKTVDIIFTRYQVGPAEDIDANHPDYHEPVIKTKIHSRKARS